MYINKSVSAIATILVILGLVLGYLTTTGTKSQLIRLIDILVIGPLMIYLGWFVLSSHNHHTSPALGIPHITAGILIFFGATTITYNFRNYIFQLEDSGFF